MGRGYLVVQGYGESFLEDMQHLSHLWEVFDS